MESDSKPVNMKSFKCPACGTLLDYSQLLDCENVVLKRYRAIIQELKLECGEIFIDNKNCLIGKIKELEYKYFILIKR